MIKKKIPSETMPVSSFEHQESDQIQNRNGSRHVCAGSPERASEFFYHRKLPVKENIPLHQESHDHGQRPIFQSRCGVVTGAMSPIP